jgi:hypothetical protein
MYCNTYRLGAAGLLPLCRLVEARSTENPEVAARRFYFDRSLIAALVDRWRPETHTFHLPCGEMTPTLQDVSYLLGLPCAGAAVGVIDMQADWMNDMHQRFGPVERKADAPPYVPEFLSDARGPTKKWILQFQVRYHTTYHLLF